MKREVRISIDGKLTHSYVTDRPLSAALDSYVRTARIFGRRLAGKRLRIEGGGRSFERVVADARPKFKGAHL